MELYCKFFKHVDLAVLRLNVMKNSL